VMLIDANPVCGWPRKYALVGVDGRTDSGAPVHESSAMSSTPAVLERSALSAVRTFEWRNSLELLVLGAIWGGSFMLQRVAAPAFGPLALVELRVFFGTLVLLPFLIVAWPRLKPY